MLYYLGDFTYLMIFLLWVTSNGLYVSKEFDINNEKITLCNLCKYFHESDDSFWFCKSCRVCYKHRFIHCGFASKCITSYNVFFYVAAVTGGLIITNTYIAYYYLSIVCHRFFKMDAEEVLVSVAKKVLFFMSFDGMTNYEIIFFIAFGGIALNVTFSICAAFVLAKLGFIALPEFIKKKKTI